MKRFIMPVSMLTFPESLIAVPQRGHSFASNADFSLRCMGVRSVPQVVILSSLRGFRVKQGTEGDRRREWLAPRPSSYCSQDKVILDGVVAQEQREQG